MLYPISQYLAEHILWLRRAQDTTPMHVLKLAYLAHGWGLGWGDDPLLDEPVEAWTYGPVVPSVYRRYKSFVRDPVTTQVIDRSDQFSFDHLETIEIVVKNYLDHTAIYLSNLTHIKGSPWDIVIQKSGVGAIIPDEIIKEYYANLAAEATAGEGG